MSDQEFISIEFPETEEDNLVYGLIHMRLRIFFKEAIINLLPRDWVHSFRAYEAIEFYDLSDFIGMTLGRRTQESTRRIMELCIDRKSTRLNSSNLGISYAVSCVKK